MVRGSARSSRERSYLRRGFGLRFGVEITAIFAAIGITFRVYVAPPDAEFYVDPTPGTALKSSAWSQVLLAHRTMLRLPAHSLS